MGQHSVTIFLAIACLSSGFTFTTVSRQMSQTRGDSALRAESAPFCVIVDAEVKEDRIDEFLDKMQKNAVGSRAEPGCLRFDVVRSQENPNRFFFYEVYKSVDAVAFHKEQSHYKLWADFKASGG